VSIRVEVQDNVLATPLTGHLGPLQAQGIELVHRQCRRPRQQRGSQSRVCRPLWHDCVASVIKTYSSGSSKQTWTYLCTRWGAISSLMNLQIYQPKSEERQTACIKDRKSKRQQTEWSGQSTCTISSSPPKSKGSSHHHNDCCPAPGSALCLPHMCTFGQNAFAGREQETAQVAHPLRQTPLQPGAFELYALQTLQALVKRNAEPCAFAA